MLSGLLNARSRFAPGAFAPVLLNILLISGIVLGWWLRGDSHDDRIVAIILAISVSLAGVRSEEHTSEFQSLMRISYAVFCLKKKNKQKTTKRITHTTHNKY